MFPNSTYIIKTIFLLVLLSKNLLAQNPIHQEQEIQQELLNESNVLEDFLDDSEEGEFDNNTVYEYLEEFLRRPLDLNEARYQDFVELNLLNDLEIFAILNYRDLYGPYISISELMAVEGLPLSSARRITPFVRVRSGEEDLQSSIPRMLNQGKNEIFLRWARTTPKRKGFKIQDTTRSRFLGDPNQWYVRFKHSFERNLSYGFTAEKDPGEEFFNGSNQQGFDFYSAHFYLKNYKFWLDGFALGDYVINLGQGLIHYHGFATGKSSFTTAIKRSGRRLKAFTSVNEANFLRGGALDLNLGKHIDFLAFASQRKIDANTITVFNDSLMIDEDLPQFSSLQISGLHRTPSEIADKNSTIKKTLGLSTGINKRDFSFNLNFVYNSFDQEAASGDQLYEQFDFKGDELLNLGADYSYVLKNFHFFGETAVSDNRSFATTNGLMVSLDRNLDIAILHRHFQRAYHSLAPFPFSESRSAQNEQGLYLGLEYRISQSLRLNAYADQWKHPWLRFGVDAPSQGNEQFLRFTYSKKRKYEIYFQARNEIKQKNLPSHLETEALDVLSDQRTSHVRLHFSHKLNKALELRNRIQFNYYEIGGMGISRGYLIYQDFIYKPLEFPLSFTARFALFDTDDYNSRIYAYENDLLYVFTIPPYFNQGSRAYINLRYRPIKAWTLEFRYARTEYNNLESISSGLNEIEGNLREDFRAQIKFNF
jgi:hypothetical protein